MLAKQRGELPYNKEEHEWLIEFTRSCNDTLESEEEYLKNNWKYVIMPLNDVENTEFV